MPFTDNKLTCQVCCKNYKKRAPYLKHIRTCYENAAKNNKLQDIVKNISKEKEKQRLKELEEEEAEAKAKLLQKHSQDIPSQQPLDKDKNNISHDSDELLQNEFVSNEPDNTQNFSSGETITVNTIVIETLLKTVLTQVIAHHNKQTQNIIEQNASLIQENKMLINMLRSFVLANQSNSLVSQHIQNIQNSDKNSDNNNDDNSDSS